MAKKREFEGINGVKKRYKWWQNKNREFKDINGVKKNKKGQFESINNGKKGSLRV